MDHKMLKAVNVLTILALLFLIVFFWIYYNDLFLFIASLTVYALLTILYLNIRETIGVKAINILMLPALFLVSAYFWIFLHVQLDFVACLMVLTLLTILYVSANESIRGYIDTGRISGEIQVDAEGERRLKTIKDLVLLFAFCLVLFFDVFAWIYMNAQLVWAILLDIIIMMFAGFISLSFTTRYFIIKKSDVSILKVIIAMIALLLVIAYFFIALFGWIYMPAWVGFLPPQLLILAALLLLSVYTFVNVKRTVDALKKIRNKPAGLINDRTMRIFNYALLIAMLAIIVVIRVYLQGLAYLGANLVSLIILLFITANIMKIIGDLS
jgi:hypothetical protein